MPMKALSFRQRNPQPDPRPSSQVRGYDANWQRLSAAFRREHPLCQRCRERPSELVHHLRPISAGGSRLDPANLISLCKACHGQVHSNPQSLKPAMGGWA